MKEPSLPGTSLQRACRLLVAFCALHLSATLLYYLAGSALGPPGSPEPPPRRPPPANLSLPLSRPSPPAARARSPPAQPPPGPCPEPSPLLGECRPGWVSGDGQGPRRPGCPTPPGPRGRRRSAPAVPVRPWVLSPCDSGGAALACAAGGGGLWENPRGARAQGARRGCCRGHGSGERSPFALGKRSHPARLGFFLVVVEVGWCTTCGVLPACKPGRSGKNKPTGQSRRSFCSEGLYSTSESSNNHTVQEPRGAPEVLALLPAPNSPKAATRLWSICYQPGWRRRI
ncbi:beta-1,4-galactosyltransferase 1 isoform X2 [Onychostruthus taczanowskii]|uniref:beta-1,4-galactosyltransferase 1 isoform X2 n=1 Tax=Onychostruthus taczanowskii TaxID=356909 RepID=UPI001B80BFD9|nr:beta-1,4-galactosyltransferase 1 isoform X2 [Onychostruthus taczanowskii]